MASHEYLRGGIYWANLAKYPQSSVQGGYRPVVIVSSVAGCISSDVVTICPMTTKIKDLSVNVNIKPLVKGRPQQVLTNQLITIPKSLLTSPSGCLDMEDLANVEQGVMTSLGILKPIVDKAKASQEALLQAKKDKEAMENLIPQAKDIINKLTEIVNRSKVSKVRPDVSRRYVRRSEGEIEEFIKEWEDNGNDRNEVAEAFGFNSYSSAYNFWVNHKKRL